MSQASVSENIAIVSQLPWRQAVVCGFVEGHNEPIIRFAGVTKEEALWILAKAQRDLLNTV